jgi:nifR3 family TIM-barrel protein
MTAKYKPGLIYCEMVKMDALIRHDPNTYRLLDYERGMHPIGAQLCGSKPELAGPCAKILEDLGFDIIDLNCGCPVDKVTKDGSGSGLLKSLDLLGSLVSNIVAAVKVPVTVKIRAGWDAHHIITKEATRIVEAAGASALCIHGRTRAQGYQGAANWEFIRECKQASKQMPIIGNGDLFDPESVKKMFEFTGCDAVLLARGTMGKPWLIEDIYRYFSNETPLIRSGLEYRDVLLEHLDHILSYQNERRALLDLRRVGCWFLKGGKGMRHLREALNRSSSPLEVRKMIEAYPWTETDFSETKPIEEECCSSSTR